LEEFKNYLVEEKEEELLKREEKLEQLDRCSRRASREALKKIFLIVNLKNFLPFIWFFNFRILLIA